MSRAPQYDHRIRRKGGYMWASETDLESLKYWHLNKCRPSSKPEYAAKDQQEAKRLSYWVAYRRVEPTEQWQGTRGDDVVTAKPPSDKPDIHSWDAKPVEPPRGDAWEGSDDKPNW